MSFELENKNSLYFRTVKTFMDLIVLNELKKNPMGAFDAVQYMNKEFNVLISSGSMYSMMYLLERRGFISVEVVKRKRLYKITEHGEKKLNEFKDNFFQIKSLINSFSD